MIVRFFICSIQHQLLFNAVCKFTGKIRLLKGYKKIHVPSAAGCGF
ncbi:hypothetical protein HMPREF1548_00042 [Clostridium sp. KLE 1755]|nr:hypothetical protein HMPREF1548_00042 [Clostridium sp. KLE 1755]